MPDLPLADAQSAAEQMRAATERLREQAWKVVSQLPTAEEATSASVNE